MAKNPEDVFIEHPPAGNVVESYNYFYKTLRHIAALHTTASPNDKILIAKWLHKLLDRADDFLTRVEYAWYLVVLLGRNRLCMPFTNNPPAKLVPLKQVVDLKHYFDILMTAHKESEKKEKQAKLLNDVSLNYGDPRVHFERPSNFLDNQPIPDKGFICYGSLFSDQTD